MKDIIGYEGKYAITEGGNVWSYQSKRFLATSTHRNGYLKVSLWKDNKQKDKLEYGQLIYVKHVKIQNVLLVDTTGKILFNGGK